MCWCVLQLICEKNNTTTQTKMDRGAQVMVGMCLHVTIRADLTSYQCPTASLFLFLVIKQSTASICVLRYVFLDALVSLDLMLSVGQFFILSATNTFRLLKTEKLRITSNG